MFRQIINTPTHNLDSNQILVVDNFDSQPFNLNEAGWTRNDISQLARATSQSQYEAIMSRLVELKSEGNIPKDTPVEDAICMIKPRFAQSPVEIEQWLEMTNPAIMHKLDTAYRRAIEKPVDPPTETTPSE